MSREPDSSADFGISVLREISVLLIEAATRLVVLEKELEKEWGRPLVRSGATFMGNRGEFRAEDDLGGADA